jgi:hypothetical protein
VNLPEDCHFGYYLRHEAWYAPTIGATPGITVGAYANDGGCAWEFEVEQHEFSDDHKAVRICMFGGAFEAYVQIPEFFAALVRHPGISTFDQVRIILDQLGATDRTDRVRPGEKEPSDRLRQDIARIARGSADPDEMTDQIMRLIGVRVDSR